MLLVKTTVGPSPIQGLGLFAAEPIREGSPIWEYDEGLDLHIAKEVFDSLPPTKRDFFSRYATLGGEEIYAMSPADDARFINHSIDPNTRSEKRGDFSCRLVARRDISEGEEITEDYYETESDGLDRVDGRYLWEAV